MKRRLPLRFILALTLAITGSFFAGVALAADYLGTGHFPTNQMYRCHIGDYATPNQNASAKWSATTDLDNYYSCNSPNIWTTGFDYGDTGWAGQAYICNVGGGCQNYDATYANCTARNNVHYLSSWTETERQFNATHELGHCWYLAHRSDTTSVMQEGKLSIIEPNATDISLVNARH